MLNCAKQCEVLVKLELSSFDVLSDLSEMSRTYERLCDAS